MSKSQKGNGNPVNCREGELVICVRCKKSIPIDDAISIGEIGDGNVVCEKCYKAEAIYETLNDSERFGLKFGLFPHKIMDAIQDDKETTVKLMDISNERTGRIY